MILLANSFLQHYFFAVVQTTPLPTQPGADHTLRAREAGWAPGKVVPVFWELHPIRQIGLISQIDHGLDRRYPLPLAACHIEGVQKAFLTTEYTEFF